MQSYRLAPNVYACASDDGAVFLDLDTDAYLGIDPDQSRALALVVKDWPIPRADHSGRSECRSGEALSFAHLLCDRGLVMASHVAEVEVELIPWEQMPWRHIRLGHVLRFLQSLVTALLLLRCRRFAAIVSRLRRRRARNASCPICVETLRALVSAFFHIRAFCYAPKARCLLDSLTLLEFLAHYDQYPRWVVGVQIVPFGSHAWVQHESCVLNGTPDYVRAYTPILVI